MAQAPRRSGTDVATIRALKARFDEAHRLGMQALARKDYTALDEAIRREMEIIERQAELIAEQRVALEEQHEQLLSRRGQPLIRT